MRVKGCTGTVCKVPKGQIAGMEVDFEVGERKNSSKDVRCSRNSEGGPVSLFVFACSPRLAVLSILT